MAFDGAGARGGLRGERAGGDEPGQQEAFHPEPRNHLTPLRLPPARKLAFPACQPRVARGGIAAEAELAYGDPGKEIIKWIEQKGCDLVAMSTHGHHFVADLFLGSTASPVQHSVDVPVLLLRAK